jgi:hypothetical protein
MVFFYVFYYKNAALTDYLRLLFLNLVFNIAQLDMMMHLLSHNLTNNQLFILATNFGAMFVFILYQNILEVLKEFEGIEDNSIKEELLELNLIKMDQFFLEISLKQNERKRYSDQRTACNF